MSYKQLVLVNFPYAAPMHQTKKRTFFETDQENFSVKCFKFKNTFSQLWLKCPQIALEIYIN